MSNLLSRVAKPPQDYPSIHLARLDWEVYQSRFDGCQSEASPPGHYLWGGCDLFAAISSTLTACVVSSESAPRVIESLKSQRVHCRVCFSGVDARYRVSMLPHCGQMAAAINRRPITRPTPLAPSAARGAPEPSAACTAANTKKIQPPVRPTSRAHQKAG